MIHIKKLKRTNEMISKEDAGQYLCEMLNIELKMKKGYLVLANKLMDNNLKKQFLNMADEEEAHAALVSELQKLLKDYWPK